MGDDQFKQEVLNQLAGINKSLDAYDTQFARIDKRFDEQNRRFDEQDLRFNTFASEVGNRFDEMSARFDALDRRLDSVEQRLSIVETKLDTKADAGAVYQKLGEISDQLRSGFQEHAAALDRHEEWISRAAPQLKIHYGPAA